MANSTKLGLMADTHENLPLIARAVRLFNEEEVDLVLHGGDFISPITAGELKKLDAELVGVFGNNDGDRLFLRQKFEEEGIGRIERDPYQFELEGTPITLMHQPKFLDLFAERGKRELVVWGHTHEVDLQEGPPLIINPGECCGLLTGEATVALVGLPELEARIVRLDD